MVQLLAGLKMEGTVKWRGLKSQRPLYSQQKYPINIKTALNLRKQFSS